MSWRIWTMAFYVAAVGVLTGCASKPLERVILIETFRLGTLHRDSLEYRVPPGVIWKLTWSSRYSSGAITPAYDVRVVDGRARIGKCGEMIIAAAPLSGDEAGLLDIMATAEPVTVWLEPGTLFQLPNDCVDITVEVLVCEYLAD